ncbi:MAG: hypothetical protein AAFP84_20730 [Actinomycetota bacterium]
MTGFEAPRNPWLDLPSAPPWVLPDDRPAIETHHRRHPSGPRYLQVERCLPEPWVGDPRTATVIVLQLNPGYDAAGDDPFHANPVFQRAIIDCLRHQPMEWPFYLLDPRFDDCGGSLWTRKKSRWGIAEVGVDVYAQRFASMEWFPYHSRSGSAFPEVPSQAYNTHLLKAAIARGAVIISGRRIHEWEQAVPELVGYERRLGTASAQQAALSPGNLTINGEKTPKAFEMYLAALHGEVG